MSIKTRKTLFYIAIFIFIGASYVAVLYAQGYKYSLNENKFFLTGAISLKVNTDAKVFFEDQLLGSTSFIGNNFGINHLLPGQYRVRLQKDGYSSWQKTITVQEGLVTEFPRILLLPQGEDDTAQLVSEVADLLNVPSPSPTPKFIPKTSPSPTPSNEPFYIKNKNLYRTVDTSSELIGKNVNGFEFSDDSKRLVWWTDYELWAMWLDKTDYQPYHQNGDRELVTRFILPIKRAAWFRDDDHVVVQTNAYRIIEIDKRGGINIIKL